MRFALLALVTLFTINAEAAGRPACLDRNKVAFTAPNNAQVLSWKESTKDQYHDRALVMGKLVGVLLDRSSHLHLEIDIGGPGAPRARNQRIEIVYNKEFGAVTDYRTGSEVYACGDYITTKGGNNPSVTGAIVHWVHMSPDQGKHSNGFLMIDGKVHGMEAPASGPRGAPRSSPRGEVIPLVHYDIAN